MDDSLEPPRAIPATLFKVCVEVVLDVIDADIDIDRRSKKARIVHDLFSRYRVYRLHRLQTLFRPFSLLIITALR